MARPASAALLSATALMALASCGSSGGGSNGEDAKSASQILSDAQAALRSATGFHVAGSSDTGGGKATVDVKVSGTSASGHIDLGGSGFDFVQVNGKIYLKGQEFFRTVGGAALGDAVGDRWVSGSSSSSAFASASTSISAFASPSGMADSLGQNVTNLAKGSTSTINGVSVITLTDSDGSLYVADTGTAYPVRIDGGSKGKFDFTEFGGNFDISAPSDSVDLSTLGVGGG